MSIQSIAAELKKKTAKKAAKKKRSKARAHCSDLKTREQKLEADLAAARKRREAEERANEQKAKKALEALEKRQKADLAALEKRQKADRDALAKTFGCAARKPRKRGKKKAKAASATAVDTPAPPAAPRFAQQLAEDEERRRTIARGIVTMPLEGVPGVTIGEALATRTDPTGEGYVYDLLKAPASAAQRLRQPPSPLVHTGPQTKAAREQLADAFADVTWTALLYKQPGHIPPRSPRPMRPAPVLVPPPASPTTSAKPKRPATSRQPPKPSTKPRAPSIPAPSAVQTPPPTSMPAQTFLRLEDGQITAS